MQSSAITASLRAGLRLPARSTTAPQITLPNAPASTTSAALTAACGGAMPWTRLRKLGSHDHRAETTISCAAPPMQTHSMVGARTSSLTMCSAALESERRRASSVGARATVR